MIKSNQYFILQFHQITNKTLNEDFRSNKTFINRQTRFTLYSKKKTTFNQSNYSRDNETVLIFVIWTYLHTSKTLTTKIALPNCRLFKTFKSEMQKKSLVIFFMKCLLDF